ncbi:nucleotidyltransferase substrate binding protein [Alcaligenaceae bacterium LF4-65]|uniref:Nucleotidyltransferase substrate binding protein n=1 Tax=Zwartia hollandica TaxID=324606 RepID=A0A953T524_9BURK|nr:nucleotidyltransferase substrate binding protein [Zwartia hollandica]MBZ1351156.1 nucleotidyltransferase substrate binding protein [Zwartia hollandica]
MTEDIRWKQRFSNYTKAFQSLTEAVDLSLERELSALEQQGLIQSFEFTHELAWKVLKDYLEYQGVAEIVGSRDASRLAFQNSLVQDGEVWMQMIAARNQTSHTYNLKIAQAVVESILTQFYPALKQFAQKFGDLAR